jgi:hypothetical protein
MQKMRRWRSATFKEYIQEELAGFSKGISTCMKTQFSFVNISGGVYMEITTNILNLSNDLLPTA